MPMKRRRGNGLRLAALLLALATALLLVLVRVRLYPLITDMARTRVTNEASNLINQSIEDQIRTGGVDYDSLITLEKDAGGGITALKTNMALMNQLKSEILSLLNKRIMELSVSQVGIPVGNLILPELFSGRGFYIPVRILAIRSSDASFQNRFSQAGINQTLHQIVMNVEILITVLTPAGSQSVTCSSQVVVAETVIVGSVPNSYVTVQTPDKNNTEENG